MLCKQAMLPLLLASDRHPSVSNCGQRLQPGRLHSVPSAVTAGSQARAPGTRFAGWAWKPIRHLQVCRLGADRWVKLRGYTKAQQKACANCLRKQRWW